MPSLPCIRIATQRLLHQRLRWRQRRALAARCNVDLGLGQYHFPQVAIPEGETAYSLLAKRCFRGIARQYKPVPPRAVELLEKELRMIQQMGFAHYFLVVHDIVRWARAKGVACSGRGSAGNSIVCHALDITASEPIRHNLLFERFLNPNRREMPDIDVDFCSSRRDEVIDHIYKTFGNENVAVVANVNTMSPRSAVRIVAEALGFAPTEINALAQHVPHHGDAARLREYLAGAWPETALQTLHSSGLRPATAACSTSPSASTPSPCTWARTWEASSSPTGPSPTTPRCNGRPREWWSSSSTRTTSPPSAWSRWTSSASAPTRPSRRRATSSGSARAAQSAPTTCPPTTRPPTRSSATEARSACSSWSPPASATSPAACRSATSTTSSPPSPSTAPDPLEAEMIGPFIDRRWGIEPVSLPHPAMAEAVADTYGVILYQEQVLRIAQSVAGFDLADADCLRRAMTRDRSREEMAKIGETFIAGAVARGVPDDAAREVFRQLEGFAAYGFNKSHWSASPSSATRRPGSRPTTRRSSSARCSTTTRWGSTRPARC